MTWCVVCTYISQSWWRSSFWLCERIHFSTQSC